MNIVAPAFLAMVTLFSSACGGRAVDAAGTPDSNDSNVGAPAANGSGDAGASGPGALSSSVGSGGAGGIDQSQSYCLIDTSRGCPCPSGSVCVAGPTSDGAPLLGCVPLDVECHGTPTCGCMHCACDGLELSCAGTSGNGSAGAGVVLECR